MFFLLLFEERPIVIQFIKMGNNFRLKICKFLDMKKSTCMRCSANLTAFERHSGHWSPSSCVLPCSSNTETSSEISKVRVYYLRAKRLYGFSRNILFI